MTTLRALAVLIVGLALPGCGGSGSPSAPNPTPSPSPDATIGAAGGRMTGADGAAQLVIPAGALSAPTGISIRRSSQGPLDPHVAGGSGIEILPGDLRFALPVTLTLRFNPALGPSGVEASELRLHRLGSLGTWEAVAGATSDAGAREAAGGVGAGGVYAVRWSGPTGACSTGEDLQFDFWLGRWNFAAAQANSATGTNDITKEGGGCLIEERFLDTLRVQGRSVSLFSRLDGRWHQTYIDSQGSRLVLVGNFDGRRMVLGTSATERFVWEPLDANTVRYFLERTADGGQTWTVGFDSRYTRR